MYSLRTKLTAAFAVTALICVVWIGVFSNLQLEYHFKEYVQQNQVKKNMDLVEWIKSSRDANGSFDPKVIENVGLYALKQGMIVKVLDENKMIWDAETYQTKLGGASQMVFAADEAILFKTFPILEGNKKVGEVKIANFGALYYNELDLHFIRTLNQIFIVVGVLSSILAILFGAFLSKRISMPITKVIGAAQSIAEGTYNHRIKEKSNTREIKALTETINQLAVSLEKQENLRKRLTGDVAHELRTPLTTIQSHVEAMIDGVWEPTVERLSSCHEELVRITGLVSDLEKLAHYESETLILNKTYFKTEELIRQVLQTFEATLAKKQIRTTVLSDDSELFCDQDKMRQVFVNLISNAVKFTGEGGQISLRVEGVEKGVWIEISDTGTGIGETDLPFIFERFYRADVSRNRMTGGSGIGLSLVKIIVEAHGGSISVGSELSQGTVFKLFLPKS